MCYVGGGEYMVTREVMADWVIEALNNLGGTGWPKEICKYIWDKHKEELEHSGDMLYTWQYDVRWAAQCLRNNGKLKAVNRRRDLPWELV